jgi:hypothetical protein
MKTTDLIHSKFGLPISVAIAVAITTTVYEALKEIFLHGVLTPWQSHSMTIVYSAIISGLTAWYFGGKLRLILEGIHEADVIRERERTHDATMAAAYHYLNNLMNSISLVNMELDATGTIDKEILKEINQSISKMSKELRELGQIDNATRENIDHFIQSRL